MNKEYYLVAASADFKSRLNYINAFQDNLSGTYEICFSHNTLLLGTDVMTSVLGVHSYGASQVIMDIKSLLGTEQLLNANLITRLEDLLFQQAQGIIVAPQVLRKFLYANDGNFVVCIGIRL
jgi:hypothetical protein